MNKKILVLSPHTDDGELGCGGTIVKFIELGADIFYVAFSSCEKSVPSCFPRDILKKEVKKSMKILGVREKNVILYDFEVRNFLNFRQDILETLIKIRDKINPDIVFTPSSYDIHQDHKVLTEESLRAFKGCTILGYEQPWNNITFNTTAFVPLKEEHLNKKILALKSYESQKNKPYFKDVFIKSLARTRGVQINSEFAEAFEVIRWIIK